MQIYFDTKIKKFINLRFVKKIEKLKYLKFFRNKYIINIKMNLFKYKKQNE